PYSLAIAFSRFLALMARSLFFRRVWTSGACLHRNSSSASCPQARRKTAQWHEVGRSRLPMEEDSWNLVSEPRLVQFPTKVLRQAMVSSAKTSSEHFR